MVQYSILHDDRLTEALSGLKGNDFVGNKNMHVKFPLHDWIINQR